MSEWRPIETAPKGETQMLVWDGEDISIACNDNDGRYWTAMADGRAAREDSYGDIDDIWIEPTHWMPLPAPPTNQD